jgi:hypothetical protein
MEFQLVAPHIHRKNAAEIAIQTFKNHLTAGICSRDKQFPLHLWDRLIPHAVVTLNLLQQSVNPKVSAYAQLNGPFDFNHTPVTPPGLWVIFHEKPQQRKTWAPHGVNGFYLGPTMEHYRCYHIYFSVTRQDQIVDTIEFTPQHCKVPGLSSVDAESVVVANLAHALLHPAPATPFKQPGQKECSQSKS